MKTYELTLTAADRTNKETLLDVKREFDEARSGDVAEQAAVFGQVWMDDMAAHRMKVRVFTGDAMRYLHKHMLKAIEMSDAVQTEQEAP